VMQRGARVGDLRVMEVMIPHCRAGPQATAGRPARSCRADHSYPFTRL
jgi:hypothetical protein